MMEEKEGRRSGSSKREMILSILLILILIGLGFVGKSFMDLSSQARAEKERYERQVSDLNFLLQQTNEALNLSKTQIQSLENQIVSLENELDYSKQYAQTLQAQNEYLRSRMEELEWLEIMDYYNLTVILWFTPRDFSRLELQNVTLQVFYEFTDETLVFDLSKWEITLNQNDNETVLFSVIIPSYWLASFTDSGIERIGIFPMCYLSYSESMVISFGDGMIQDGISINYAPQKESMQVFKDTEWHVKL